MDSDGQTLVSGIWHPPQSSRAIPARLIARGRVLAVRFTDGEGRGPEADLDRIEISRRVGRVPRRLAFADGSMFETADNDAVDAFLARHNADRWSFIHGLEAFRPRLIGLVALTALLVFGLYRYTIPVLVEVAVHVTPEAVPRLMSQGTLQSLDQTVLAPSGLPDSRQQTIRAGFSRLAALSERGASGYTLNFRKGGVIGPNAFALPDGTLIITDELIALAGGDDQMIFGVLAHEIGHVEHEHSLRQLYRVAGTAGLIMLIAGDVGAGVEDVMTNGAALLALSYSRDAETEADRHSVELMHRAGMDPLAIGRFFALLETKLGDTGETSIISTHPGTPGRRQAIEDHARSLSDKPAPAAN